MKEPKTGRLFCVNCNLFAVTEAEYAEIQAKKAKEAQNSPSTPTQNTSAALNPASDPFQAKLTQQPPFPEIKQSTEGDRQGTSKTAPSMSSSMPSVATEPAQSATLASNGPQLRYQHPYSKPQPSMAHGEQGSSNFGQMPSATPFAASGPAPGTTFGSTEPQASSSMPNTNQATDQRYRTARISALNTIGHVTQHMETLAKLLSQRPPLDTSTKVLEQLEQCAKTLTALRTMGSAYNFF